MTLPTVPAKRLRTALLWLSAGAVLAVGCGGGASSGAKSADDSDEDYEYSEEGDAPPVCEDGTCFACGEGLCPTGFYCDESAVGGPACGWLPECARETSCSCVEGVLGTDCSCDERDDGVYIDCG